MAAECGRVRQSAAEGGRVRQNAAECNKSGGWRQSAAECGGVRRRAAECGGGGSAPVILCGGVGGSSTKGIHSTLKNSNLIQSEVPGCIYQEVG